MARHNGVTHDGIAQDINLRIVAISENDMLALLRAMATKVGFDVPANADIALLVGMFDELFHRPDALDVVRPVLRRCGIRWRRFALKDGEISGITGIRLSCGRDDAIAEFPALDIHIDTRFGINYELASLLGDLDRRVFAWVMKTQSADSNNDQNGLLTWGASAFPGGYEHDICIGDIDELATYRLRQQTRDLLARVA